MKNALVAYFSCTGTTRATAQILSEVTVADTFEIKPQIPYTEADLDWTNVNSRSTREMKNPSFRPAISDVLEDMDSYDTVFVGFPIWWYVAPTIINTFLESYDFSGKTIIPFATSGGSGLGKTEEILRACCSPQANWKPGKLLNRASRKAVSDWVKSLDA